MPRYRNFLAAAPLIAWFGWELTRAVPVLIYEYRALGVGGHTYAIFILQTLGQAVGVLYTCLVILLLAVRTVPVRNERGVVPYAATFVGAFATTCFFSIPLATLSAPLLALADSLVVIGLSLSVYTLLYLGRSFALLPGARSLVTRGPYRYLRHPLYLFEEVAIVGLMLQLAEPWALLVTLVQLAAQFVRMRYEERILAETFPEYAAYAATTARLIPGVY